MRYYKKSAVYSAVSLALLALSLFGYHQLANGGENGGETSISISPDLYYSVTRVVDGDTFKASIGDQEITVRVLGINTPETVDPHRQVQCYGREASKEAHELLDEHKVKFSFSPDRELKDKYGRYLAYVYRDDGLFYNQFMLENGFAREYTVGSVYSMQTEFRAAQKLAQQAGKGLWTACAKSDAPKKST